MLQNNQPLNSECPLKYDITKLETVKEIHICSHSEAQNKQNREQTGLIWRLANELTSETETRLNVEKFDSRQETFLNTVLLAPPRQKQW